MVEPSKPVEAQTSGDLSAGRTHGSAETDMIPVLEETFGVSKRRVTTGMVRVSTRTESFDDVAEIALDHSVVDVTRVPVGRIVEAAPATRVEGDTTIVPVIEERLVVVKQLVLVEEVHIRRRVERQIAREPVSLRRQQVFVERYDGDGRLVDDDPNRARKSTSDDQI